MQNLLKKYKPVVMPFGRYKGRQIYDIAKIKDGNGFELGKEYLKWIMENVELKNQLLEETIDFYINVDVDLYKP